MSNPFDAWGKMFNTLYTKTNSGLSTLNNTLGGYITGQNAANTSNAWQYMLQKDQQQFNADEAEKQRQWSARSIQNSVADLKAAGLNPWLVVQGGLPSSASTSAATSSQGASDMAQSQVGMTAIATASIVAALLKLLVKK